MPTESVEQQCLFRWAAYQSGKYPELRLLFHIPNEGRRSAATGARLKAEGLKAGVPDLFLPVARGGRHGLFVELKSAGGRASQTQKEWISALSAQGYEAAVCVGWVNASELILSYLKGAG